MLSTSRLAEKLNVKSGALFHALERYEFIVKKDESWTLTDLGEAQGGKYQESKQYGKYIVWPEDMYVPVYEHQKDKLTASQIGAKFKLSSHQMNQLLGELGWIVRSGKGWVTTPLGKRMGADQRNNVSSEIDYVVWDSAILLNARLLASAEELLGCHVSQRSTDKSYSNFRQKFEAKYHCADGHYVRTIEEMHIDNWLYLTGVTHAYARTLPIEQDVQSSFYLPRVNIYLEFKFGNLSTNQAAEFEEKLEIYKKYGLKVLVISEDELSELDKSMPKRLSDMGVTMSQLRGQK